MARLLALASMVLASRTKAVRHSVTHTEKPM